MNIDEIYDSPELVKQAVKDLHWENARIESIFVGYEDHGILTMSIMFKGDGWGQGFGSRMLTSGNAFRNFVEGALQLTELSEQGKPLRVGRGGPSVGCGPAIVAIRPLINEGSVFWPGGDEERFYVFDSLGEVKKRGRG